MMVVKTMRLIILCLPSDNVRHELQRWSLKNISRKQKKPIDDYDYYDGGGDGDGDGDGGDDDDDDDRDDDDAAADDDDDDDDDVNTMRRPNILKKTTKLN